MVFSSLVFIFLFLPIVLLLHTTLISIPKMRWCANLFLLTASIFFYAWGEPKYVLIIISVTIINYFFALLIEKLPRTNKLNNLYLFIVITTDLGILAYFKYASFLLDITGKNIFGFDLTPYWDFASNIALPLGISFYTFQAMSYVIDVTHNEVKASKNFLDFACYITMFPQLVAGPIVRYKQIAEELLTRKLTIESFKDGIIRFIIGLAKKVIIADTLGRVADAAFAVPAGELPATAAWLGIICYTFQIYYDFSGYSDMAIGMGKMLGFTFPENFNYPYISKSIREFWRRWHITLSLWFRDYLYIPLGGSRCSKYRVVLNSLIVFALCGLWHGANYGFLFWGFYHGFFLALERIFPNMLKKIPVILQYTYSIFVVMMGWVLFRAVELEASLAYYKALFGMNDVTTYLVNHVWFASHGYALPLVLIFAIIFSTPIIPKLKELCIKQQVVHVVTLKIIYYVVLLHIFLFSLLIVFSSSYKSFIYFRF